MITAETAKKVKVSTYNGRPPEELPAVEKCPGCGGDLVRAIKSGCVTYDHQRVTRCRAYRLVHSDQTLFHDDLLNIERALNLTVELNQRAVLNATRFNDVKRLLDMAAGILEASLIETQPGEGQ